MRVWRLGKGIYPPLDGEGSRLYGGRWNSAGVAIIYTASHLSLAVVELLVHTDSDLLSSGYVASEIEIPDTVTIETLTTLPNGWDAPTAPAECQRTGDIWVGSNRSLVLAVPSVVVPDETNYLINPLHPDISKVRVVDKRPFSFDPRLVKRGN